MSHHVTHAAIDQRLVVRLRIDFGLDYFLDAQRCVLVLDVIPLQAARSAVALVVGQFLAGIGGGFAIGCLFIRSLLRNRLGFFLFFGVDRGGLHGANHRIPVDWRNVKNAIELEWLTPVGPVHALLCRFNGLF